MWIIDLFIVILMIMLVRREHTQYYGPGFNDLPSVLILIISDQIYNDSLCCFNKYN